MLGSENLVEVCLTSCCSVVIDDTLMPGDDVASDPRTSEVPLVSPLKTCPPSM